MSLVGQFECLHVTMNQYLAEEQLGLLLAMMQVQKQEEVVSGPGLAPLRLPAAWWVTASVLHCVVDFRRSHGQDGNSTPCVHATADGGDHAFPRSLADQIRDDILAIAVALQLPCEVDAWIMEPRVGTLVFPITDLQDLQAKFEASFGRRFRMPFFGYFIGDGSDLEEHLAWN